ncbi:MAG: aldehyde dehydrogenase family protein [Haliscomenobacter sp.]
MSLHHTYTARNPRTGEGDYSIPLPTGEDLHLQCAILRQGQAPWASRSVEDRINALQRWKAEAQSRQDSLVSALAIDTGRIRESALEVQLLFSGIDRWCGIARDFFSEKITRPTSVPFIEIHQETMPNPLVGIISPWNFPLLLSIIDAIPALLAGCAVLVKPSEITPRFIEPLQASIDAVPELSSVFRYIAGNGQTGQSLIPKVDLVCFTGSVATGKKVYSSAAEHFIPCFLELGGKDPALVFEGADLEQATSSILWGSCVNCGHSCLSIERVYVQESILDEFLERLTAKARKIRLAYPNMESGELGPVISVRQAEILNAHLKDAIEKGARLHCGDEACQTLGGGLWLRPTVLSQVHHGMLVMTEETFGPILPVMPFPDEEEAIRLANASQFGLSAAVFAATWQEAERIGRRIEAGAISINDCALTAIIHEGEKQSFKNSGIGGTRMGPGALRRFFRQKAMIIKKTGDTSPWWWKA